MSTSNWEGQRSSDAAIPDSMASSRFYEHFSETSFDVHVKPPSLTASSNFGNRKRVLSRIQERSESMQKRQTSTLNCNGLAFRHTTFVPDPDMHFTVGAGSKSAPGERKGHRRNKTPTTLAALAGFYLLPYALRKAVISSRERVERKERKQQTRENTICATGRHDSAIGSDPRLATPSLGSTLDIQVPQSFDTKRNSSSSGVTLEPIFNGSNKTREDLGTDDDDLTPVPTSPLSSVCTGERIQTLGTRLSDLQEVSEISEVLPEEVNVPMPCGGTTMLVRGWSSSSEEEELSPGPPKGKGKGRIWREVA